MNIMIFGANGGIGKWAVKHALQNGHNVTAYVRDSSKTSNQDKNLTVIQGEVTDAKKITEAMLYVSMRCGLSLIQQYVILVSKMRSTRQ